MSNYCKGCIYNVMQTVVCIVDGKGKIICEPSCMAERCIRRGLNGKHKSNTITKNCK
jgi:hypothetical protein